MNKDQLLNKIDELKLLIMMGEPREKDDVERFDEWVARMQGRHISGSYDDILWSQCNKTYSTFKVLKNLVEDLDSKKYGNSPRYHRDKWERREMIAEIVAEIMFIQEEIK